MNSNYLTAVATTLSILGVVSYGCGTLYLSGYLEIFDVSLAALDISTFDRMYYGFLKPIKYIIYGICIFFILSFCLYLISDELLLWVYKTKIKKASKKILSIGTSEFQSQKAQIVRKLFYSSFILFSLIVLLCYLFSVAVEAQDKAREVLKDPKKLTSVVLKKSINDKYHLILCGSSLCAVLDNQKNIHYIEAKDIIILSENFKKNS